MAWGNLSEIRDWNYLVEDFRRDHALLHPYRMRVEKSVHVQAEYDPTDPVGETRWLHALIEAGSAYPHAIVGGVNLADPDAEHVLAGHREFARVRGVRQLLNQHDTPHYNFAERDFLNDPVWRENLSLLAKYDLTFDLQIYPHQALAAAEAIRSNPDVKFCLNHGGMPIDRDPAGIDRWKSALDLLSREPNAWAKISGLAMVEPTWNPSQLRGFVDQIIASFGVERSLFASNFPIDRLRKSYAQVWWGFNQATSHMNDDQRARLFHDNAVEFYRL